MNLQNVCLKWRLMVCLLIGGLLWVVPAASAATQSVDAAAISSQDDDPKPRKKSRSKKKKTTKKSKKKSDKKSKKSKKGAKKSATSEDDAKPDKIRWGQRRNESNEKYDKRYARMLKRIRFDAEAKKEGDKEGEMIGGPIRLWTYMGNPFIVRTDISQEFTADTAMYMELLHREYSSAYAKMLGVPAEIREKIEVVVYKDQETYMKAGGMPGSGGSFGTATRYPDRGDKWPALRFRLTQFTNGVDNFADWEKGVLKHESAHMEFQMRLGLKVGGKGQPAVPVQAPLWFNEGQAMIFEDWDFDLTVDENFAAIHKRGRYSPVIRRIYDTDRWKDFNYIWTIDPGTWQSDMTEMQGFLNYAQAWSLAAYMMNGGGSGKRDFRTIFNLSKRIGGEKIMSGEGSKAWDKEFPPPARSKIDANWRKWVADRLPKSKSNPGDDLLLMRQGYRPDVTDHLEPYTQEELEALRKKFSGEDNPEGAEGAEGAAKEDEPTTPGKPRIGKEEKGPGEKEAGDETQDKAAEKEEAEKTEENAGDEDSQ